MIRAQIQFERQQYERLRRLAHKERISIAEAVRRLVDQSLDVKRARAPSGIDALLAAAGTGKSKRGDLGRHHDDILAEDLEE